MSKRKSVGPVGYFDDPMKRVKLEHPVVRKAPDDKTVKAKTQRLGVKATNRRGRNREKGKDII